MFNSINASVRFGLDGFQTQSKVPDQFENNRRTSLAQKLLTGHYDSANFGIENGDKSSIRPTENPSLLLVGPANFLYRALSEAMVPVSENVKKRGFIQDALLTGFLMSIGGGSAGTQDIEKEKQEASDRNSIAKDFASARQELVKQVEANTLGSLFQIKIS